MRTENLVSTIEMYNGVCHEYHFPNGYGASVIRHEYSQGWSSGKWELAVLKKHTNTQYYICYDTPITDDVIGHLSEDGVDAVLADISRLEAA